MPDASFTFSDDTYIQSNAPGTNKSTLTTFSAGFASSKGGYTFRTLLKTQISLPGGATIGNPYLSLHLIYHYGAGLFPAVDTTLEMYKVSQEWWIDSVTWNLAYEDPPASSPWSPLAGGTFDALGYSGSDIEVPVPAVGAGRYSYTCPALKAYVEDAIENESGLLSIGLIEQQTVVADYVRFYSTAYPVVGFEDPLYFPYLVVPYSLGGGVVVGSSVVLGAVSLQCNGVVQ